MGGVISKPKKDLSTINKISLTYSASTNKEFGYLFSFNIDDLNQIILKKINNEIYEITFMINHDDLINKIMKVLQYYLIQTDINIRHVDCFYFRNKCHGKVLHLTNINAYANREIYGIKTNRFYFIDCDLDNI
jgi:hypothetical protein